MEILLGWIVVGGGIGAALGALRGSAWAGFWLGFFLGPLGWLVAVLCQWGPKCSACGGRVDPTAPLCMHCGTRLMADDGSMPGYRRALRRRQEWQESGPAPLPRSTAEGGNRARFKAPAR
jgi:hypothetical protein